MASPDSEENRNSDDDDVNSQLKSQALSGTINKENIPSTIISHNQSYDVASSALINSNIKSKNNYDSRVKTVSK
jgi:hypothetical protein